MTPEWANDCADVVPPGCWQPVHNEPRCYDADLGDLVWTVDEVEGSVALDAGILTLRSDLIHDDPAQTVRALARAVEGFDQRHGPTAPPPPTEYTEEARWMEGDEAPDGSGWSVVTGVVCPQTAIRAVLWKRVVCS